MGKLKSVEELLATVEKLPTVVGFPLSNSKPMLRPAGPIGRRYCTVGAFLCGRR
jgi:hypothetical protein